MFSGTGSSLPSRAKAHEPTRIGSMVPSPAVCLPAHGPGSLHWRGIEPDGLASIATGWDLDDRDEAGLDRLRPARRQRAPQAVRGDRREVVRGADRAVR